MTEQVRTLFDGCLALQNLREVTSRHSRFASFARTAKYVFALRSKVKVSKIAAQTAKKIILDVVLNGLVKPQQIGGFQ